MHLNLELSTEVHFEYQDSAFHYDLTHAVHHQRANISVQAWRRAGGPGELPGRDR